MVSRIHGRILHDLLRTFVLGCLVVLGILAIGQLSQLLSQAASGRLPLGVTLQLLGLATPTLLVTVLPLAFFFSVYLVFSNLYRSNEMIAIRSAGLSLLDLLRALLLPILAIAILEALLSLSWSPAAQRQLQAESLRLANAAAQALIQPGSFARIAGGRILYVGESAPGSEHRYREIFVDLGGKGGPDIATAAYGEIQKDSDGGIALVLIQGHRYLGQPGTAGFKILSFARYRIALAAPGQGASSGGIHWAALGLPQLLQALQEPQQARHALSELEWRLIWPLLIPILALLAIPLAFGGPRGAGRATGALLGILTLLAANNLLVFLKEGIAQGRIGGFPGIFWVLLLLGALAGYAFWRRQGDRPVLPAWLGLLRP
ncbi:MAG: LPS export ABC transporter permease LptF [Acidithiobacillus sp.]